MSIGVSVNCANGLCFKCSDKYNREHQCKNPLQLLTIEIGDFGEILSDETLQVLDLLDTPQLEECYRILVHAVAGTEEIQTVRLRAWVGNQIMLILVDSGSTHSFVNKEFATRASCAVRQIPPVTVKVANGAVLQCLSMVS